MSEYVTNESWVRSPGRADAIDDIADQFERRVPPAPIVHASARWPRSARGWRSVGRLHPRSVRGGDEWSFSRPSGQV